MGNLDETQTQNGHVRVTGRMIFSRSDILPSSVPIRCIFVSLQIFFLFFLKLEVLNPPTRWRRLANHRSAKPLLSLRLTLPSSRQEFTHYYELLIHKRFSKIFNFTKLFQKIRIKNTKSRIIRWPQKCSKFWVFRSVLANASFRRVKKCRNFQFFETFSHRF